MKKQDTQESVRKMADQLLFEGIKPTQQNVRERLGSGSITTINKALNGWWQDLGQRLKANSSHPMIPDPVAETASRLWHQSLAYAEKHLEQRREQLEQEYSEKRDALAVAGSDDLQEIKTLREQCLKLLQDTDRLSEEKFSQMKISADLENQLIHKQAEVDRLQREIKQQSLMMQEGGASRNVEEFIEQQVTIRILKEENIRLKKQLDTAINENSTLKYKLEKLRLQRGD